MGDVITRAKVRTIATNFTRPNDTNAYTAGDVVDDSTSAPTIMTFTGADPDRGGSTILMSATCISSANQATKPDLRLWLFDTAMVMDNDNAVFTPTDAEMRTVVAIVAFPVAYWLAGDATSGTGGNSVCQAQNLWLPINSTKDVNDLYGVLVINNAYTPVAQERFDVRLAFVL